MLHSKRHIPPTGTDGWRAAWRMIARVDAPLLGSLVGWVAIGLVIGRLTYAALVRRPAKARRADLPLTLVLSLVGALIGGAVGWSTHGELNAVLASLIGAVLGGLVMCILFQFIVPV